MDMTRSSRCPASAARDRRPSLAMHHTPQQPWLCCLVSDERLLAEGCARPNLGAHSSIGTSTDNSSWGGRDRWNLTADHA